MKSDQWSANRPGGRERVPEPDIDAALAELATSPVQVIQEPWAGSLLWRASGGSHAACDAYHAMRRRIRRCLQHPCSCCGTYFSGKIVSEYSGQHRHAGPVCPACAAAHRRRCISCGEVFTADTGRRRRCEPCRRASRSAAGAPDA